MKSYKCFFYKFTKKPTSLSLITCRKKLTKQKGLVSFFRLVISDKLIGFLVNRQHLALVTPSFVMLCGLLYQNNIYSPHIETESSIASRENRLNEKLARGLVEMLKGKSNLGPGRKFKKIFLTSDLLGVISCGGN